MNLLLAAWLSTQQWAWSRDPSPGVTEYRLYWTNLEGVRRGQWCPSSMAMFSAATSCGAAYCRNANECCGDVPMPTRPLVIFTVTAINALGESYVAPGKPRVCP